MSVMRASGEGTARKLAGCSGRMSSCSDSCDMMVSLNVCGGRGAEEGKMRERGCNASRTCSDPSPFCSRLPAAAAAATAAACHHTHPLQNPAKPSCLLLNPHAAQGAKGKFKLAPKLRPKSLKKITEKRFVFVILSVLACDVFLPCAVTVIVIVTAVCVIISLC
jgi:hypothetical protein